ncbi:MAG: hypothetical protein KGI47_01900 [Betaproteobacteria bacterium]|nr:hypothetical protein [Betaproteobacteria bacterium]MDE2621752.1 hypothetical protein [Betaproteobacteria bacterium]
MKKSYRVNTKMSKIQKIKILISIRYDKAAIPMKCWVFLLCQAFFAAVNPRILTLLQIQQLPANPLLARVYRDKERKCAAPIPETMENKGVFALC